MNLASVNLYYMDGLVDPSLVVKSTGGALVHVVSEPSSGILVMLALIGLSAFGFAARHFRDGHNHTGSGSRRPSA